MSLFEDAALELQEIINDDLGASLECLITSPDGINETFQCRMSDISQTIDRNNHERTSGRQIVVSLSMLDLKISGFDNIRGVAKKTEKPWIATFSNVLEVSGDYKVAETAPDNTLGIVVLYLEVIK